VLQYVYRCEDASIVCPAFRRLFCVPFLELVPAGVSANLLTLAGSASQLAVFAFVSWRAAFPSPHASPMMHLVPALGLFVYVLLDNADGMQARRTNTSSPLGEFVDHWLDNFATFMIPLGIAMMMGVGDAAFLPLVFVAGTASWAAYWEQRASGVQRFAAIGEMEGNLLAISCYVLTAIFGPALWEASVASIRVAWLVIGVTLFGFACSALRTLIRSARCRRDYLGVLLTATPILIHAAVSRLDAGGIVGQLTPLLLGLMLAKHVGDLQREHLLGKRARSVDVTLIAGGAVLVAATVWAPPSGLLTVTLLLLGVVGLKLAHQFADTTATIRAKLGIQLLISTTRSER
jgi:phosphatidylglycerophosphate synthase